MLPSANPGRGMIADEEEMMRMLEMMAEMSEEPPTESGQPTTYGPGIGTGGGNIFYMLEDLLLASGMLERLPRLGEEGELIPPESRSFREKMGDVGNKKKLTTDSTNKTGNEELQNFKLPLVPLRTLT